MEPLILPNIERLEWPQATVSAYPPPSPSEARETITPQVEWDGTPQSLTEEERVAMGERRLLIYYSTLCPVLGRYESTPLVAGAPNSYVILDRGMVGSLRIGLLMAARDRSWEVMPPYPHWVGPRKQVRRRHMAGFRVLRNRFNGRVDANPDNLYWPYSVLQVIPSDYRWLMDYANGQPIMHYNNSIGTDMGSVTTIRRQINADLRDPNGNARSHYLPWYSASFTEYVLGDSTTVLITSIAEAVQRAGIRRQRWVNPVTQRSEWLDFTTLTSAVTSITPGTLTASQALDRSGLSGMCHI